MKYGRKLLPVRFAKALDGEQGLVEAYCSVFNNVDYSGEVIRPGFFAQTIAEANTAGGALPKILWSHMMFEKPLGHTTEAEEVLPYDSRLPAPIQQLGGLKVVGKFNMDVQESRDVFHLIKAGDLDKYSIGYYVIEETFNRETGIVELLKGDWIEWSPVNFPANDMTLTVGAKTDKSGRQATEHIYYVRPPQDFVDGSYKRELREVGTKQYVVVTGKLRATGDTEEASIRFEADAWSAQDARDMCQGNKGRFEAATPDEEGGQERLADHGARVVALVRGYLDRLDVVKSMRVAEGKVGRELSEANRTLLAGLLPDIDSVRDRVQTLVDRTAPNDDAKAASALVDPAEIRRLHARLLAVNAELVAVE